MHHRKCGAVILPAVVLLLLLLLLLGTSVHPAEALRCRSNEGPSTEDVKRIVRTCLNKITNTGSTNRSSDEYPDYDSSASDETEEKRDAGDAGRQDGEHGKRGANGKPYFDRRYDERGNGRMNWPDGGEGDRRMQMENGRDQRNGMDGGGTRMGDRSGRDRADEERQMMMRDYGRGHHRRKRQYHGGQGAPSSSGAGGAGGGDYASYGRMAASPHGESTSSGNGSSGGNSSSIERDRACLMQCFFEELKATNADGFPEKHKVLHVITKDIREHELREFYVDSIQECFHMLGMDSRLKDKCDYSMRFVTCLSDRFQSNCEDWDSITSAMF